MMTLMSSKVVAVIVVVLVYLHLQHRRMMNGIIIMSKMIIRTKTNNARKMRITQ